MISSIIHVLKPSGRWVDAPDRGGTRLAPGNGFGTGSSATGSGLGLSICQKLVERQNGRITVQSTPGEGTTFTIFLPEAV
ncbi:MULTISPECIES: ATP-binding protein [unclassified Pannonibacter]|uniref:ATP-binding protein n=1 Tax=unclassified Pannonibacter TaxID=2627228 RepID=UPI0021122A57|nr:MULTISPECIES: HAMP domain-containing sensor histidine kinase [unclassified Pannonibacter]